MKLAKIILVKVTAHQMVVMENGGLMDEHSNSTQTPMGKLHQYVHSVVVKQVIYKLWASYKRLNDQSNKSNDAF